MKKTLCTILILLIFGSSSDAQNIINSDEEIFETNSRNSLGFTILGDGLGLMFRHHFPSKHQLGVSLAYMPLLILDGSENYWFNGFMLKPEFNVFLGSRIKEKQNLRRINRKIKKHYFSVKQGFGYAGGPYQGQQISFNVFSTTLSWHQERFFAERNDRGTGFDLGISYRHMTSPDAELLFSPISIFLRWDWEWFL